MIMSINLTIYYDKIKNASIIPNNLNDRRMKDNNILHRFYLFRIFDIV
jgi:hypothetical protein